MSSFRILGSLTATVMVAALSIQSARADYPEKEITLISPSGPGARDTALRLLAPCIGDQLGQPTIVVNKPGANTQLGANLVKAAKPDGYTLLFTGSSQVTDLVTTKTPTFDIRSDLEPISRTIMGIQGIFVNASLPIRTIPELIDYAKKNPGKMNFGSIAPGSVNQLTTEALALTAGGLKLVHIPYSEGTSAMLTALMANEVQLVFTDVTAGQPAVESGKVRLIAVVAKTRLATQPNVPTLIESVPAMAEHSGYLWYGMFAPPKTPVAILDKVQQAIKTCLGKSDVVASLGKIGYESTMLDGGRPAEFKKAIADDVTHLQDIVKRANIEMR